MKRISFYAALLLLGLFGITSCNIENKTEDSMQSLLVGTWEMVLYEDKEDGYTEPITDGSYVVFTDKLFYDYTTDSEIYGTALEYTLYEDKIMFMGIEFMKILELNKTTLKLQQTLFEEENDVVLTFKKKK